MLNSPRIIVRAAVVALSAAVISGSAYAAQASEGTPDGTEGHRPSPIVTATQPTMDPSPVPTPPVVKKTVVKASDAVEETVEPVRHKNYREARSKVADVLKGEAPSVYTGKFYNPKAEKYRACITEREAENIYTVVGGGDLDGDGKGDYQGAYQLSPALAEGATWMMAKESKEVDDGLFDEIRALQKVPANKWSRYYQDRAFFTILNWEGDYSGAKHWAGGRWSCSPGM